MDRIVRSDRVWLYFTFFEGRKKENKKIKNETWVGRVRGVVQIKRK